MQNRRYDTSKCQSVSRSCSFRNAVRNAAAVFLLLLIIPIAASCAFGHAWFGSSAADTEEMQKLWKIDNYPANVFTGISAPLISREKMIQEALYQCARSIAISQRMQVSAKLVSESSSVKGLISYAAEGNAVYWESEIGSILSRLELLEVRGNEKIGIVVVAADPEIPASARPYKQTLAEDGKPDWISRLPVVPGYIFAVGETMEYRFIRDSIEAADFAAAKALIEISPAAVTEARSYSVSKKLSTAASENDMIEGGILQVTDGILENFLVTARWYDPDLKRFYSLASVKLE